MKSNIKKQRGIKTQETIFSDLFVGNTVKADENGQSRVWNLPISVQNKFTKVYEKYNMLWMQWLANDYRREMELDLSDPYYLLRLNYDKQFKLIDESSSISECIASIKSEFGKHGLPPFMEMLRCNIVFSLHLMRKLQEELINFKFVSYESLRKLIITEHKAIRDKCFDPQFLKLLNTRYDEIRPEDLVCVADYRYPMDLSFIFSYLLQLDWQRYKRIYRINYDLVEVLRNGVDKSRKLTNLMNSPYDCYNLLILHDSNNESRPSSELVESILIKIDKPAKTAYVSMRYQTDNTSRSRAEEPNTIIMSVCYTIDLSGTFGKAIDTLKAVVYNNSVTLLETFAFRGCDMCTSFESFEDGHIQIKQHGLRDIDTGLTADVPSEIAVGFCNSGSFYVDPQKTIKILEKDNMDESWSEAIDYVFSAAGDILSTMLYIADANSNPADYKPIKGYSSKRQQTAPSEEATTTEANPPAETEATAEAKPTPPSRYSDSIETSNYEITEKSLIKRNTWGTTISVSTLNRTTHGITKSPHIRKGHIHRYWVGKKGSPDRHLEERFLEAISVKGEANNKLNVINVNCKSLKEEGKLKK